MLGRICGLASIALIIGATDTLNSILYAQVEFGEYVLLAAFILGANFFLQTSISEAVRSK